MKAPSQNSLALCPYHSALYDGILSTGKEVFALLTLFTHKCFMLFRFLSGRKSVLARACQPSPDIIKFFRILIGLIDTERIEAAMLLYLDYIFRPGIRQMIC